MDIAALKKKRQLNVQQQNALTKAEMVEAAAAVRANAQHWLQDALRGVGLDFARGVAVKECLTPCGCARADWVTDQGRFYVIEADVDFQTEALLSVESCRDVTATTPIDAHQRGTGKSFGCLALEVCSEIIDVALP